MSGATLTYASRCGPSVWYPYAECGSLSGSECGGSVGVEYAVKVVNLVLENHGRETLDALAAEFKGYRIAPFKVDDACTLHLATQPGHREAPLATEPFLLAVGPACRSVAPPPFCGARPPAGQQCPHHYSPHRSPSQSSRPRACRTRPTATDRGSKVCSWCAIGENRPCCRSALHAYGSRQRS